MQWLIVDNALAINTNALANIAIRYGQYSTLMWPINFAIWKWDNVLQGWPTSVWSIFSAMYKLQNATGCKVIIYFPPQPLRPHRVPRFAVCGLSKRPFFPAGLFGGLEGPASPSAVVVVSFRAAGSVGARARLERRFGVFTFDLHWSQFSCLMGIK